MRRASLVFLMMCLPLACAEPNSEFETCQRTFDCSKVGNICYQGQCVDPNTDRACSDRSQCLDNEQCIAGFCSRADVSEDTTDATGDTNTGTDTNTTNPPDTGPEDTEDTIPPTIEGFTPAEDSTDVALDTTVTVTFSEEVIEKNVKSTEFFFVTDPSNAKVPATIAWDVSTLTATMTFDAPLGAWTTYTAHVTSSISDLAQNSVVERRWDFTTTASPAYAASGFYEELARAYAPVIHQDVGSDPKADMPVRVDYDDNEEPSDNANRVTRVSSAAIYYSVAETTSHYFVTYVLYYPVYKFSSSSQHHTVNGLLVAVEKDGTRLGKLAVAETYTGGFSPGQINSWVPSCSANTEPFCPTNVSDRGSSESVAEAKYAANSRNFNLYVSPGVHDLCHFTYNGGSSGYCKGGSESYLDGNYSVLTVAANNDNLTLPETGNTTSRTGEYGLYPLPPLWWSKRDSFGADATNFYATRYEYTAPADTQPGHGAGIDMPRALNTSDTQNNTGLLSPWGWRADDGFSLAEGVWFVDPAYALQARLNMGSGYTFQAADYCYNLYTNIDRTGSDAGCQPAQ